MIHCKSSSGKLHIYNTDQENVAPEGPHRPLETLLVAWLWPLARPVNAQWGYTVY